MMDRITGLAPKPRARKVAISRVRAATALYMVFSAPKSAPNAISAVMNTPIFLMKLVSIVDCSARNSLCRMAFTLSCGLVVSASLNG